MGDGSSFRLADYPVHLGLGAEVRRLARFVTGSTTVLCVTAGLGAEHRRR